MTLNEAIKNMETIAEENQRVVDTGIVFNNVTIDMLYCDDTEVIEEHLANYQRCAEEHRQIAEWLRELKQLMEQTRWIPCSERLPEDKTYVMTTIRVPGRQPHVRSGWYRHGLFMNDNGDIWKSTDIEVIAWMPLPEPYKAESEG